MTDPSPTPPTGGKFLLQPIGAAPIFTREAFSQEQREIEGMVRDFGRNRVAPLALDIEKKDEALCRTLLREMGELGLLSLDVPEKYGGLALDKTTSALVAETLRHGNSSSFAAVFAVQTGIGMLPIVWFGSPAQKEKYLPKLASGEWIGAYALTEPSSGSDALAAKSVAVLDSDRDAYLITGEKQFITNGAWANIVTLFAQLDGKFTAFLIDRGTPGLEIGPEEHKLGVRGSSTVSLKLTQASVRADNILGKPGDGSTIAFNALNVGRLKLGAAVLGGAKGVIGQALLYALERRQFGRAIATFDSIQKKIADMVVRTFALDAAIYRTTGLIDEAIGRLDRTTDRYYLQMGEAMEKFAIEASMAKVAGSETLAFCADTAIQIYGGYGFIEEYPMARIYRDTRIDRIWEGTNEINRQIITGYLMKKALLEEIPLRDKIRGIDSFLEDASTPGPDVLSSEKQMVEAGKMLILYAFHEALCEFGQDLKHEQQLGEALADCFTDLYLADSALARIGQMPTDCDLLPVMVCIGKTLVAEASLQLLNRSLFSLNAIYHGRLPKTVIEKLRHFQVRLLPQVDLPVLRRTIARSVFERRDYPF